MSLVLELPETLQKEAARLAQEDGISLSQWVTRTIAQRLAVVETAAQFFQRRGQGTVTLEDALAILDAGPDLPPVPGDELPEGYTSTRRS